MRWRVYSSGTFLGFATADTDTRALDRARLLYDERPLQVVTEAAWETLNAAARALFETGAVQVDARPVQELCKKCRRPVPQTPPRGKRTGRPRRIHDECLSPAARRWRHDPRRHANQRAYRAARKQHAA